LEKSRPSNQRESERERTKMEHTQTELQVVAKVLANIEDEKLRQLNDVQLALVGGGVGEITPF